MTDRRTVWIVLVAATALRAVIAAQVPLADDEAYYWAWAQRLAWGYPDHPPAIAALIRATTTVLGDTPLGVRAGPILLAFGIAWLLYDLGRSMFSAEVGALVALWFQTIPMFSIGGILSFPDAPFIFFWLLAMRALWGARGGRGAGWWIVVGVAVGLAALSKLATLFLGISVAGYLLWGERERRWWRRGGPYAAAVLTIALVLPMLQWNAAHGGVMVEKIRSPYEWFNTGIPILNALAYAGGQLIYYGPITAVLLIVALLAAWAGVRAGDRRYIFTLWMALPILGSFAATSFDGIAKPHWTAPAYLVALLPAAALWTTVRVSRWWRAAVTAGIALNLAFIGALGVLVMWPGSPIASGLRAWPAFIDRVEEMVEETPREPGRFILVPDYQTAAQIEYHLRGAVVATPFGLDAYDIWISHQRLIGWNAVYLTADRPLPGLPLARMFRRVESLPPVSLVAAGWTFRTYAAYRGIGYRGFPRPTVEPN